MIAARTADKGQTRKPKTQDHTSGLQTTHSTSPFTLAILHKHSRSGTHTHTHQLLVEEGVMAESIVWALIETLGKEQEDLSVDINMKG